MFLQRTSALKQRGITLIELCVVIAIVAILATLALPSYEDSVRKGRRAEAQKTLLEFAGTAERIFTESNTYATATLPANTSFYTFTLPTLTATSYTIRAVPTSIQSDDKCGTMTLAQTGERTPDSGALSDCW